MDLRDQVCSLELSERLKQLNVKQDSLFYWFGFRVTRVEPKLLFWKDIEKGNHSFKTDDLYQSYSAFTVSELLALLPEIDNCYPKLKRGYIFEGSDPAYCLIYNFMYDWKFDMLPFTDENAANSCAKVLIYLIKNGYIKYVS